MGAEKEPRLLGLRALGWADGHRSWRWLKYVVLYVAQAAIMWWAYPRQVSERQWFGDHRLLAALFLLPAIALTALMVFVAVRWVAGRASRRT